MGTWHPPSRLARKARSQAIAIPVSRSWIPLTMSCISVSWALVSMASAACPTGGSMRLWGTTSVITSSMCRRAIPACARIRPSILRSFCIFSSLVMMLPLMSVTRRPGISALSWALRRRLLVAMVSPAFMFERTRPSREIKASEGSILPVTAAIKRPGGRVVGMSFIE